MVAPVPAQIPNLRPRPPAAPLRRRSLPLLTTHYPLSTLFFVSPLFSYSYELLFPQPLYLDNDPHCPPGVGVQASNLSPNSVPPRRCLPRPCRGGKSIVFRHLLPLTRSLRSFLHSLPLFSIVCSLFPKNTRVGGIPRSSRQPQTFRDRRSDAPGPHESSPSTFVLRKLEPILYPQSYCPCTPSQLHSSTLQEAFL